MNSDEKDLLHRHLNGDLDASEQAAFFARLQASPELRRELASLALDESLLSEIVLEKRTVARPKRRNWLPAAIAAAMLIALSLVLTLGRGAPSGMRLLEGAATLERGDTSRPLDPGVEVREGDRLRTSRAPAVLDWAGERIERDGDSTLGVHGKGLTLSAGALRAVIPPKHELQLHIVRGHVIARAATVRVRLSADRAWVEAEEGVVTVHGNGSPVRIAAGQYAVVGARIETGRLVPRAKVDDAVRRACAFLEL